MKSKSVCEAEGNETSISLNPISINLWKYSFFLEPTLDLARTGYRLLNQWKASGSFSDYFGGPSSIGQVDLFWWSIFGRVSKHILILELNWGILDTHLWKTFCIVVVEKKG